MTNKQKEIIKNNLDAFVHNFGNVRIEDYGMKSGFYVFCPASSEDCVQYCYNIDYLNGWLYGAVQAVHNRLPKNGEIWKDN